MMNTTTVIKNFVAYGQEFVVVKNEDGFYLAINKKYIGTDGKTTQKLNGLQMHASKDLNQCLESARSSAEIDDMVAHGMTRGEAFDKWLTDKIAKTHM